MSFSNGWYSTSKYLIQVGLCYFTALLPFQPTFLPASLGIMIAGVGWLMMFPFHRHLITFNKHAAWVVAFLVFYYLLGIDFSLKSKQTSEILSVQIPMLFWGLPFVLYYKELENSLFKLLEKIFVVSSIFSALFFLVNFIQIEIENIPLEYSKRSPYFFLPVHYLGMYYNVALAFLLFGNTFKSRIFAIFSCSILILSIVLLSVRMQWIILTMLLSAYTFFHIKKSVTKSKFFYLAFGTIAFVVTVLFSSEVHRRIQETIDEFRSIKSKKNDKQTNHRVFIWKEAINTCRNLPITGFKPGIADSLLMAKLEHVNAEFWDGEKVYYLRDGSYNYHNQFLQALAERGIGIILLIGTLTIVMVFSSHPASNYIVLIFVFSMFTESILQRQAGVFLFSFLMPFLAFFSKKSVSKLNS
ncbi:MAG: O-antigen ligase family protein [Thermaurantimonas sp.]|uniref:O-antigen ligase family protein n=1 Tax=Thermaurantimonas sp. TaxID=2681568 RepID=UPI00391B6505